MAFILDPNAATSAAPSSERFFSMSVTRNAAATISPDAPRANSVRATMRVDDIDGARPRSLPPARSNFHETRDIEGAQPRPLHVEKRNHPSLALTNHDIEGKSSPSFLVTRSALVTGAGAERRPQSACCALPRYTGLPHPRFAMS